jgi:hypothetical protein
MEPENCSFDDPESVIDSLPPTDIYGVSAVIIDAGGVPCQRLLMAGDCEEITVSMPDLT